MGFFVPFAAVFLVVILCLVTTLVLLSCLERAQNTPDMVALVVHLACRMPKNRGNLADAAKNATKISQ